MPPHRENGFVSIAAQSCADSERWKGEMMMYCSHCGASLTDGTNFCPDCGAPVKAAPAAVKEKVAAKQKWPILILLLAAIVLLGGLRLFQYRGYRTFVEEYFSAMESGDQDAILRLYDWEYVQTDNERILEEIKSDDAVWFTSGALKDYVFNHDKYYRFLTGETVERWEITNVSKNLLSFSTPYMEVEALVVYEGRTQDVVVEMEMERGDEGWYMTDTDAYYAPDETEQE